ncbi:MAG: ABC-2 family transporter protein [Spirochaetales bacterium]|nr:ABC-2 family transporter protein [Spirochaetales bacterium]
MALRKYASIFAVAGRDQWIYLPAFLARNVFFVIILFVFFSLWRAIFRGEHAIAGFTMVQLLWYLTVTETIELSQTRVFGPISREVKDGTVAYALIRPYSYVLYWVSRAMGENLVKVLPLLVEGAVVATLMVGPLPGYLRALPFALLTILGGILIGTMLQTIIGLLAFWFEEVMPFWWIIQKSIFVIGGLFIPVDFYPPRLERIARLTPFAFAAYWPASTWVDFSWERFITTIVGQALYLALFAVVAATIFRAAVRTLHVQGG